MWVLTIIGSFSFQRHFHQFVVRAWQCWYKPRLHTHGQRSGSHHNPNCAPALHKCGRLLHIFMSHDGTDMARTQTCCEYIMYDSDAYDRGEEAPHRLSEASEVIRPPLELTSCVFLFAGCCVFSCTLTACWGTLFSGPRPEQNQASSRETSIRRIRRVQYELNELI